MKINDTNVGLTSGSGQAQRVESGHELEAKRRSGGAAGEDHVQLSSLAGALSDTELESPERAARLEQLAAEYREGRYKVNPDAVADAILDDGLKGPGKDKL